MAERKKISELDFAQSVSSEDEFLMIDKSVTTGDEAAESGKTSKVTLSQLKDGIFSSGLPQGDKGEKGQQGASVTGPQGPQGASVTGSKGQKGQQGASVTGAKGPQGTSIKGEPGVGSDGDSFFTQTSNGISYNAGNIAVGTSSTTAKLEVQGDLRVSRNSIYASHWHMGISHTDISDYGTLGFYSNSDTGDVAFYPNGSEVFRIKKSGEMQYKNGGNDFYSSQAESVGNDNVKLHFGPNYSYESGFRKTLTLDNQKVGIGTTSPATPLHVNGDTRLDGNLIFNPNGNTSYLIGGQVSTIFRNHVNDTSLLTIKNSGNVGIGTTDPEALLHLDTSTTTDIMRFGADGRWGFQRAKDDSRYVSFSREMNDTAQAVFTIDGDNGNIGIGTDSPDRKLDVAGSLRASHLDAVTDSGYSAVFSKTNKSPVIKFMGTNSSDGLNYSLGVDAIDGNNNRFHINRINDADQLVANLLTIKSNGNVGIGTDSPDTQLQIQNNGGTNSYGLQILGNNTEKNRIAGIFDTHIASTDRSAGALTLHNSATTTEVFISSHPDADSYINNGGNVGIGDSNPSKKLSVAGDAIITGDLTVSGKVIGNQNLASIQGSATSVGYELDADYGLTLGSGVYLGEPKLRIFRGHDEPEQSFEMSAKGITLNNSNDLAEDQSSFSIKQKGDDGERVLLTIHSGGSVDMMNTRIAQDGVQIFNEKSIFMQSSSATKASYIRRMSNGLSISNSATSAGDPLVLSMPFYLSSNYGGLSVVNTANEEVDLTGRLNKSPEEFNTLEGGQITLAYAGTRPSYVGETTGSWQIDSKPFDKNYAEYDALRFFTKDLNDNIHTPFVVSPIGATVSNRGRFSVDDADGSRDILDVDNPLIMLGQEALKVESGNAYQIGVSNLYNNTNIYDDETQTFNGLGKGYMGVDANGFFRICGNGNNIDNADSAIGTSALGGVGLMDGVDEIARFQSENIALHNSVTFNDKTTLSAHAAITRNGFSLSKTWDSDPNLRAVVLDSDLGGQSHILGSLGVNVSSIGMNNVDKLQVNGSSTLDGNVTVSNTSGKVAEFKDDEIVFHKPVSGAGANFPGMITAAAVLNAPVGWHECNGELLLKFDYINLWNAIGDLYALPTDTDVTMFRLPDLRGRVIAGVDSLVNGSYANNLMHSAETSRPLSMIGETDGSDKHALTEAEIPAHTHTLADGVGVKTNSFDSGTHVASDAGGRTGSTGGDQPHNNVQPTMVLSYFIKL